MLKWLLSYLKKYRFKLLLSSLFAAASGALLLVGPLFLGKAIDALTASGGVRWDELYKNLGFLLIFYFSGAALSYISPVLSGEVAARAVTDIRSDVFKHILRLPLRFFDTRPHGDVIARITTDCENIYDGLGQSFVQLFSGIVTVIGTMIALYHRDAQEGGKPQEVDVALYEGLFRMQDSMIADYDINHKIRERKFRMEGSSVPSGKYCTKDNKWFMVTCATDNAFYYLAEAMGRKDLIENYPTMADRFANEAYILKETTDWAASHTLAEIAEACKANKVAMSPIYSIEDIWNDPQYKARHNLVEFESPDFGKVHIPSVCPVLSETPGEIRWIGQPVGSFNEEVYKGLLGKTDEELQEYKEKGII